MTPNEYLQAILAEQTFESSDQELKDLRRRREDIRTLLVKAFAGSSVSIRWAGAMAKGTMIRESYDGDMTCYFEHEDTEAGENLKDIYDSVAAALEESYLVERKKSALRVRDNSTTSRGVDLHIDVVPGRFTDDVKSDVFIHQRNGDKQRLKTNLQTHVEHIKDSGVVDAIRLMKLWNVRNGVNAKTFVLELLVIKLLKDRKSKALPEQLKHVWEKFRDHADSLAVEDPANPAGNDLKPALDACRASLSSVSRSTLEGIDSDGWESVFGDVETEETGENSAAAVRAAVASARPTRPWCRMHE